MYDFTWDFATLVPPNLRTDLSCKPWLDTALFQLERSAFFFFECTVKYAPIRCHRRHCQRLRQQSVLKGHQGPSFIDLP
jgi:hypothetical protein